MKAEFIDWIGGGGCLFTGFMSYWSHARSKVYKVKITKPKVKLGLSTRSPLRRYSASCSCDAGKGTKMRKRYPLSCKHIAVVYSYFSVWSSEIFLLLTINEYQLVSRLDSVSRSWRFILWDLEFKFGSIQLVGHFCLFNNIQIFASDNPKRLYWHFHFLFIIYQ